MCLLGLVVKRGTTLQRLPGYTQYGDVIKLCGELASILDLSGARSDEPRRITGGVSVSLVAGVGFEPTTFRL